MTIEWDPKTGYPVMTPQQEEALHENSRRCQERIRNAQRTIAQIESQKTVARSVKKR